MEKYNIESLRRILKSLNTSFIADKVNPDEDLFAQGVLDSLLMIQFVMALETDLNIRLDNDDITYEKFKTFDEILKLLNNKYIKG